MEIVQALQIIEQQLPQKRYIHTLGVLEAATALADKYHADINKVKLAAIFHDYAKYRPIAMLKEIVIAENMDQRLLFYGEELLHAPVGAFLVKQEVGISDQEILNAISYHTTGRKNMSVIEKIIYLADYIEPNRSFSGLEEVRKLAQTNLEQALLAAISNTIHYLLSKQLPVFPDTFAAYNQLILKEDLL